MEDLLKKIKKNILRQEISHRGGGIEISLDFLGKKYVGQTMAAYQNYLGGGMLGSIQNDCTIKDWFNYQVLVDLAKVLSRYFHSLTVHDYDEWENCTFEENQERPSSVY